MFTLKRISILLFACLITYGKLIEPRWIQVNHYSIINKKLTRPLKIAHLSDLHIREIKSRETKIQKILTEESPDVIVISGDSIAENGNYEAVSKFLAQLKAPLGVWTVSGNWEHWVPNASTHADYGSPQVTPLNNASAPLFENIWLVGLDDSMSGTPHLSKALEGVPQVAFRIALFHSPDFFDRLDEKFDLALTGHTHGGQVRIPFLPPLWLPDGSGRFVSGWYRNGSSQMYVSKGLGNSIFEFRLFCRPELAFFTLHP